MCEDKMIEPFRKKKEPEAEVEHEEHEEEPESDAKSMVSDLSDEDLEALMEALQAKKD
jgi:hypothetical protein